MPNRASHLRIRAAVVAFFTAALVAGCGSEPPPAQIPDDPGEAVAFATATTSRQSSAKVSMAVVSDAGGLPVRFGATGAFDFEADLGRMTLDMSGIQPAGITKAEIVFAGTVFYMKMPELAKMLPGGKPWLKFDLKEIAEGEGTGFSQFGQLGSGDPTQSLNYLRGAGEVEEVGDEEVRGVETTRYHIEVDLLEAVRRAPQELRSMLREAIDSFGSEKLPMDVWVDDQGLVRRLLQRHSYRGAQTRVSMEFFDYGADVDVEVPADSQVTDISALLGGADL
jgi:hypothetical protein